MSHPLDDKRMPMARDTKTPRELLEEARQRVGSSFEDVRHRRALYAICDLLEQHQAWMDGARLVIEAHNAHAVRTLDEAAIRADERERIAKMFECGEFPTGGADASRALARLIREAKP